MKGIGWLWMMEGQQRFRLTQALYGNRKAHVFKDPADETLDPRNGKPSAHANLLTCQLSTLSRRSEHKLVPIHGRDACQRVDRYAERFEGFPPSLENLLDQCAD